MLYPKDSILDKHIYIDGEIKNTKELMDEALTSDDRKLILGLDKIPEDSERWNELLSKVEKKAPMYDELIKYAIIKAEHIPKDIRMKLIKNLTMEELKIVLSLKDVTEEEIRYYVKTKRFHICSELIEADKQKKVSKKTIDLLLSLYSAKELEKMQFAPFQIAKKENEIVEDKIEEVQKSGIGQKNMERFCMKVINNINIREKVRDRLFDEEDVNFKSVTNPTAHMCDVITDACIQTLLENKDKNLKNKNYNYEIANQLKLANEGIQTVLNSKTTLPETIQKLIDTLTETKWYIPINLFSQIKCPNIMTEWIIKKMHPTSVYEILINEDIYINKEMYERLKRFVPDDYAIYNGKIDRAYFHHMLSLRSNVSYDVDKEIAKEPDEEIKYMRFCSFLTPDNNLNMLIENEKDEDKKQIYNFFRFVRTEIRKVAESNYELPFFVHREKGTLNETKYFSFYAILKSIMDKELDEYNKRNATISRYRFGVKGKISDYIYTEKQYVKLKRAFRVMKNYYPTKEKLLNEVEKELDIARKKSAFIEKQNDIFSFTVFEDGMVVKKADIEKVNSGRIRNLASEINNIYPYEKDIYKPMIEQLEEALENTYYNKTIYDIKEVCEDMKNFQCLSDSISQFHKNLPEQDLKKELEELR